VSARPGDTLQTQVVFGADIYKDPSAAILEVESKLPSGKKVVILDKMVHNSMGNTNKMYKIKTFDGQLGWVAGARISRPEVYNKNQELFEKLRGADEVALPVYQRLSKNTAHGVSLDIGVFNIDTSRTIKYLHVKWKLFNRVGDSVEGQNTNSATANVRISGPVKPLQGEGARLENVWYSKTGLCAEIRGMKIEFINGKTTRVETPIDTLSHFASNPKFLSESALSLLTSKGDPVYSQEGVFTRGDCSYKAQQQRREESDP